MTNKTDESDAAKNKEAAWWQPAMVLLAKLSGWIAVPIIIAPYLGKWLDKKHNSAPRLLLFCIAFAFFVSMIGMIKESAGEYKKIDSAIECKKADDGGESKKADDKADNLDKRLQIDKKL